MSNTELLARLKDIQDDLQDGFRENALAKIRELREDLQWEEGTPRTDDDAPPEGGPVSAHGTGLPAP